MALFGGLIKRMLGLEGACAPKPSEDKSLHPFEHEASSTRKEPTTSIGDYSVPEHLNPRGFYSVRIEQGEMYDLGNFDFIPHFILYDRKENIAVDVTSDVAPAPLLSATRPAECSLQGATIIEAYLTGKDKPQFTTHPPRGVRSFIARELVDECYLPLRARMVELRDAHVTLLSATNAFREQAHTLRTQYLASG